MSEDSRYLCSCCHFGTVPLGRYKLGYSTCLPCGEQQAKEVKHTVVPMPKSNYILVTDKSLLKGLNSSHKGGLV